MPRRPLWGRFRTVEAVSAGPWGYLFRVTEALTGEPRALHVLADGGADAAFDELSQRVRQRDPALPRIFELGRTRAPIAFGAAELAADQPFVLAEWSDGEPALAALFGAPEPSAPEPVADHSAAVIHELDPEPTVRTQLAAAPAAERPDPPDAPDLQLKPALAALEAAYIAEAMRRAGGNQTVAARLLGLSRFGLQKKLKRAR
jgi:hypothetical protein